jgi:hypothetical protein
MADRPDSAESEAVLLRTTADVLSHALVQFECCAGHWPQYHPDAGTMREMVERLVEHAREYGYIEKRRGVH